MLLSCSYWPHKLYKPMRIQWKHKSMRTVIGFPFANCNFCTDLMVCCYMQYFMRIDWKCWSNRTVRALSRRKLLVFMIGSIKDCSLSRLSFRCWFKVVYSSWKQDSNFTLFPCFWEKAREERICKFFELFFMICKNSITRIGILFLFLLRW